MRFYTKEWYNMMQVWGLGDNFKKIPDGDYSDDDIQKLYDKALRKRIAEERKFYNIPPELFIPESLDEETFDPEEWLIIGEDESVYIPDDPQEVRDNILAEYEKACEEFDNRPEFDSAECIGWFKDDFAAGLKNARTFYPAWLREECDERLIALGLLPETTYKKYKDEIRRIKKEWKQINRNAAKTAEKQQISSEIHELFDLHDAYLLSLRKKGNDCVMDLQKGGTWSDDKGRYRTLVFKNAQIIEKDSGITTRKRRDEYGVWTNTSFLYYELYKSDSGYEIHIMFWAGTGLAYLTLTCSDVQGFDFASY